jgi:amidase
MATVNIGQGNGVVMSFADSWHHDLTAATCGRGSDAFAMATALTSGDASVFELDAMHAERRAHLNDVVNAVVTTCAVERPKAGSGLRLLEGVPVTVKDTFELGGVRTTAGDERLREHVPTTTANCVQGTLSAGARVIGKTNVPKLAGDYQTFNDVFGLTRNPHDLDRTAGGSSGGGAAAVVAGISALDLGSDTAGSIRLPAAYCGLYAYKPSYGLLPVHGHIPPGPGDHGEPDITTPGVLARSARDLATWFASQTPVRPPGGAGVDSGALRLGVFLEDPDFPIDGVVAAQLRSFAEALRGVPHVHVQRLDHPPRLIDDFGLAAQLVGATTASSLSPRRYAQVRELVEATRAVEGVAALDLSRGAVMSHREWLEADAKRAQRLERWHAALAEVDALVLPTAPVVAYPHDVTTPRHERTLTVNGEPRPYYDQLAWCAPTGYLGFPSVVMPIRASGARSGLPTAAQLVGPRGSDARLLSVALALSAAIEDRCAVDALNTGLPGRIGAAVRHALGPANAAMISTVAPAV